MTNTDAWRHCNAKWKKRKLMIPCLQTVETIKHLAYLMWGESILYLNCFPVEREGGIHNVVHCGYVDQIGEVEANQSPLFMIYYFPFVPSSLEPCPNYVGAGYMNSVSPF